MTPFQFEGQPWNLDRRLGPVGGNEPINGTDGVSLGHPSMRLDPFPASGIPVCAMIAANTSFAPTNCEHRVGLDMVTNTLLDTNITNATGTNPVLDEAVLGSFTREANRRGRLSWNFRCPNGTVRVEADNANVNCSLRNRGRARCRGVGLLPNKEVTLTCFSN